MSNLTEKDQWEDGVYQLEKTDPVVGGPDGLSNRQAQQLGNRTRYLKGLVDSLLNGTRNAAIAAKLATARALNLTGDASGSANFDGSANASITVTLAKTGVAAGTYGGVTVDDKGRVTSASTILPVANGGTGNATGQAPSAAKLATARTINGVPFDGTGNIAITDDSKAPLNSAALTGTPTTSTPAEGSTSKQIANAEFVANAVAKAIAAIVNGAPDLLNQFNELAAAMGNDPNFASTMFSQLATKAPLASPALTGSPTAPTAALGNNSGLLATTGFVAGTLKAFGMAGNPATNYAATTSLDTAPMGSFVRAEGSASNAAAMGWPSTGASAATQLAFNVVTEGVDGSSARLVQIATEVFGASGGRGRTFVRVRHDANWYSWREFAFLDALSAVATSGKFSDLLDQADHVLKGATAANGWKLVALQNLEATGNLSLEYRNSAGITTISYQGGNDGKGGWRPRLYYTKSGDAGTDRRTLWGGVNDSDVVEFAGPMQVRQGGYLADASSAALCVKSDAADGTGGLTVNNFAPALAMVDRTAGAYSSRWRTDGDNLALDFDNANNGASWAGTVLNINRTGEIRSLYPNNYRLISGDYGTFWRNDGSSLYLMITAAGAPWGNWNGLRPFAVDLASGRVVCSNGLGITTAGRGDNSTNAASTAFVQEATGTRTAEIAFFPASTAPAGFLKANGALVSRTTYAALFAIIGTSYGPGDGSTTFALPDLRGEFLRGWDDGRGVDGGRSLHSSQSSQNLNHTHTATAANAGAHSHTTSVKGDRAPEGAGNLVYGDENYYNDNVSLPSSVAGDHTHSITVSFAGGTESRPRNIALLACIKY